MFMPKIIFDMPLNHREITVYRCLCDKANRKGECYPNVINLKLLLSGK